MEGVYVNGREATQTMSVVMRKEAKPSSVILYPSRPFRTYELIFDIKLVFVSQIILGFVLCKQSLFLAMDVKLNIISLPMKYICITMREFLSQTAWYMRMPAATETLKESTMPFIGILQCKSDKLKASSLIPLQQHIHHCHG